VLDAGAKALAKDRAEYVDGFGAICELPGSVITALYDHHAVVRLSDGQTPHIGQQVSIIPNHVCPVVNLTDRLHIVSGGNLIDVWPVDTRGRH
jgi:D-serine deaminase-like pyridoxal phosphate-dependent protein